MACRASQCQELSVAFASHGWHFYLARAVEIVGCHGVSLLHFFRGALKHDIAPLATRKRTDVDDIVGLEHHVAIMLNHDDGIAHVTQFLERMNEQIIVTLMKAD